MNNITLKHIIIIFSILILLIPTLQISRLERNWRNGTAQFVCNENMCVVKTFDESLKCINTKEINIDEIVSFKSVVDKTRARNNYAAYVIMAVKENGESFDFFEVDTYYDPDYKNALSDLKTALVSKKSVNIYYPKSRIKNYSY